MRITRTLFAYLMRETLVYCGLAFCLLTLVLLTQNLLRRLDELFLIGMTMQDIRVVIECILPVALSHAIPLAFLVGIILSIRRLGTDGELRAFRAAGISPAQLLLPYLCLGLLATTISGWLLTSVEYQSRRELVQLFKTAAARGAILEPGKFRQIGPRLVFVEDRDRDGKLHGVMIVDQSKSERPFRIFADQGRFRFNEEKAEIELELSNGELHFAPIQAEPDRYERLRFEAFSYRIGVGHILGGEFGPVRPKQMNLSELRVVLERADSGDPLRELDQRDPIKYALEIHRRRALPLAPFLFSAVAVPIALASEQRGRTLGLILILMVAFGYYALTSVMQSIAHQPWFGVELAAWTPNLIFSALAILLMRIEGKRIPA
jgi:LPS export ABC transporter permease LptF